MADRPFYFLEGRTRLRAFGLKGYPVLPGRGYVEEKTGIGVMVVKKITEGERCAQKFSLGSSLIIVLLLFVGSLIFFSPGHHHFFLAFFLAFSIEPLVKMV